MNGDPSGGGRAGGPLPKCCCDGRGRERTESGRASLLLHAAAPLASFAGFPLSVFPSGCRGPPQEGSESWCGGGGAKSKHSDERTRDRSRVITEQRKREGRGKTWKVVAIVQLQPATVSPALHDLSGLIGTCRLRKEQGRPTRGGGPARRFPRHEFVLPSVKGRSVVRGRGGGGEKGGRRRRLRRPAPSVDVSCVMERGGSERIKRGMASRRGPYSKLERGLARERDRSSETQ